MTRDIDFVHLNLEPLSISIRNSAREWMEAFGKMLNESARENLHALKAELEVCLKNCRHYFRGFMMSIY